MTSQLYLGDCLDIMRTMPDKSVDAVITDPPYGTQDLAGGYGRRQLHDKGDGLGATIQNDNDVRQIQSAYPHFGRLVADGFAAVFYAARKTPEFINATSADQWFGNIVWDKGAPGLGYHIRYSHEDIAIFKIGSPERPAKPIISVIRQSRIRGDHPHEKPIEVITKLIEWVSEPGDTVLDPFMGSGTTGVACAQTGRNFIGIEIDPTYFAIAQRRIHDAEQQPLLFA